MQKGKIRRGKMKTGGVIDGVEFEVGSNNIFADFGLPDAEEMLVKSTLASLITRIIIAKGWDQTTAARHLGTHQPVISDMRRGRLKSVTYDRLVSWLKLLGYSVTIEVKQDKRPHTSIAIPHI